MNQIKEEDMPDKSNTKSLDQMSDQEIYDKATMITKKELSKLPGEIYRKAFENHKELSELAKIDAEKLDKE
jgi:hypothetical protein